MNMIDGFKKAIQEIDAATQDEQRFIAEIYHGFGDSSQDYYDVEPSSISQNSTLGSTEMNCLNMLWRGLKFAGQVIGDGLEEMADSSSYWI
jgi:hypothetical protein